MSERVQSLLVKDIPRCIMHPQDYTSQQTLEDFAQNFMAIEACLYNIQVIGEAVSRLSEEVKDKEPGIPWKLIKGMRNKLIHEYFGTDLPVVGMLSGLSYLH